MQSDGRRLTGRASALLAFLPGDVRASCNRFAQRFGVQGRVVRALLIREMMSRYGRRNIGFLWLVAEPLILTGGIILVWTLMKRSTHGVPIVSFALTGYTMLTLWRSCVHGGVGSLRRGAPLFFHQNVRPLDALASRTILDNFGALMSFTLAYLLLLLTEYVYPVSDFFLLAGAWWLMSIFTFGITLMVAGLTERFEAAERFVQPLMYLSLPLSGAFTMMAWLGEGPRSFLLYSPMVHATEMFRAGFMGDRYVFYHDALYLGACAIGSLLVGLTVFRRAERNLRHV